MMQTKQSFPKKEYGKEDKKALWSSGQREPQQKTQESLYMICCAYVITMSSRIQ